MLRTPPPWAELAAGRRSPKPATSERRMISGRRSGGIPGSYPKPCAAQRALELAAPVPVPTGPGGRFRQFLGTACRDGHAFAAYPERGALGRGYHRFEIEDLRRDVTGGVDAAHERAHLA